MIVFVVLILLGDVLEDLEVGGDDVIPRDKRQVPQLSNEDLGIHIVFICLHEAVFAKTCARGLL